MDESRASRPAAGSGGSARPAEDQNPLDWAREIGAGERVSMDLARYLRRRRRRRMQFAAAAAGLVLGAATLWRSWPGAMPRDSGETVGEVVVLQPERRGLPDGSVVELGAGALIEVSYGENARHIALRGGPAHFAVAKDAARPFVVAAGGVATRAVGTAFVVDPAPTGVTVLVTEGRVAVARSPGEFTPGTPTTPPLAMVGAGEGVRVNAAEASADAIAHVPAKAFPTLVAWRMPRLKFARTPLAKVLGMFNAQGAAPVALDDPASGSLEVSGVLRADDLESLFRLLEADFGLVAEQRDGSWRLRKR